MKVDQAWEKWVENNPELAQAVAADFAEANLMLIVHETSDCLFAILKEVISRSNGPEQIVDNYANYIMSHHDEVEVIRSTMEGLGYALVITLATMDKDCFYIVKTVVTMTEEEEKK